MKELSLNILDITMNSVKANADFIKIELTEDNSTLEIKITDNGCGMEADFLKTVTDAWSTTRTTRKVGMGIPFFKLAAEQTGGGLTICSTPERLSDEHGTVICAVFCKTSIDFTPLGDIVSTITTLIQGSPDIHWIFCHKINDDEVSLDTDELKAVLGDVGLDNHEVLLWISDYLKEAYTEINYKC